MPLQLSAFMPHHYSSCLLWMLCCSSCHVHVYTVSHLFLYRGNCKLWWLSIFSSKFSFFLFRCKRRLPFHIAKYSRAHISECIRQCQTVWCTLCAHVHNVNVSCCWSMRHCCHFSLWLLLSALFLFSGFLSFFLFYLSFFFYMYASGADREHT